jgi:hypothetical protein
LSRGDKEYTEPDFEITDNKNEIAHRFSKVFMEGNERRQSRFQRFDSIKEIDLMSDEDEDYEDYEDQEDEVHIQERLEMKKHEEAVLDNQRKNIAKLTKVVSLRPSLAKIKMIKKLREKRELATEAHHSRKSSVQRDQNWSYNVEEEELDNQDTTSTLLEEFKLMSM